MASKGDNREISERVEQHLLHFEQTWGQPGAPSIEQLLSESPESERENLLRELLFIEFEFIQRKALEPLTEQYLSRFPEYEKIIHEVAQAVGQYAVFKRRNVAGYTLFDELGRGGMGTVYKAKSDLLNNLVAFKMVSQRVIDNPESLKRFIRELEMIGRLKHPNIVEAKHAGVTDDGTPYLVMEFVEGITLAQWGKQNPPSGNGSTLESESTPPSKKFSTDVSEQKKPKINSQSEESRIVKACDIIHAVALGLQAIHEAGLVHRDIKPGNIMLLPNGQVKILDLGLAKLREHIAEHSSEYYTETQQGQFLGTPGYIAPEQMHSAADVDIRADIYSLGCTFFYLLYGRTPSERQVDEIPMEFPRKIRAILNKMLAADPASRFQKPREVVDALDSLLGRKRQFPWGQTHWGKTFAVVALSFAVFFGILFGILLSKPSNHVPNGEMANSRHQTAAEQQPSPNTVEELVATVKSHSMQPTAEEVQEAVGHRYRGNAEVAEKQLLELAIRLRENPFEGSDDILAEVLSALGDCLFFEGFASDSLTEKKVQRMKGWYNEAQKLVENSPNPPDEFHMKLLCKLAVVNNEADAVPLFETRPSLYHLFAERVTADDRQSLRRFVEMFELISDEELFTREALDLRLFAWERLISWAMANGCKNLPADLQALDSILLTRYPDEDSSIYLSRFFDLAVRACDSTDFRRLVRYMLQWRRQNMIFEASLVVFYFSPWDEGNGFALYCPSVQQDMQRFELPFNRAAIKEAIRKGETLELCEPLVALVRRDIESGVPIVLSWDDTACWSLRRDAISNEDWCFEQSLTIEEIIGQMK